MFDYFLFLELPTVFSLLLFITILINILRILFCCCLFFLYTTCYFCSRSFVFWSIEWQHLFFSGASLRNIEMKSERATKAQGQQGNHSDSQVQEFTFMFYFFFCGPQCRPVGGLRRRKMASPACSWRQQRKHLAKGSNNDPRLTPTRWRRRAMFIRFCQLHGWCWMTVQISQISFSLAAGKNELLPTNDFIV